MSEQPPLHLHFDEFELDEANARLTRRAQVLGLAPRAFSVLCALARRPSQLVTKDELLDAVWGHRHVSESVLKSAVRQLRVVLDDDAKQPRVIETAWRRGYRFIAVGAAPSPSVSPAAEARPPARSPITGRAAALSRLQAAWSRASAGQRQLCWLVGEAGVGKTTLVDHFAASLSPVIVAQGQCVEQHGAGEPYLPVLEALATLSRDDPALAPLLRNVAPTWLLQMPWLCSEGERERLRRELVGIGQDRMLREFGELLDRYTQDRPLLLVTEDLHWSDLATVNLINHVGRRRGMARWMWLATFRVAEVVADDHPVKAVRHELRLHKLAEEILIDPFSEQELADFVASRVNGVAWPETFVKALHRHTDGLPLFAANVIDDLQAQGALPGAPSARDAATSFDTLLVPESLAGVIERQILRLHTEQIMLLEAASVCGVEFRPAVVAQVIERDAVWVAEQCDLLAREQRWLASTQVERAASGELEASYAFRHALVRRVVHERMGALARARLHRRVAQALVGSGAPGASVSAAELATQFALGQDPDTALPYFAAASASALQQFAPADALLLSDRGLEVALRCRPGAALDELVATLHTLRGGSAAQVLGVSADETLRSFERAHAAMEDRPQHPLRGMALHGLGLGQFLRHGPRHVRALTERSLAQAKQRKDTVLIVTACDLLGQMLKLEGPPGDAIAVLEQGINAAATLDEQTLQTAFVLDPLVNMRAALAIPLLMNGCDQSAQAQSDLAISRARDLKQPMAQMIATWLALLCDIRRGAHDGVATLTAQLRQITDDGGLAQSEGASQWLAGLVLAWSGRPIEGHAQIDSACRQSAEVGMLYGTSEVLGYATEALLLAKDWTRAAGQVDEALELAARLHDHSYRTQLLLLKRRVALAQDNSLDAVRCGREAVAEARHQASPWLEMAALVDICDSPHARADDLDALRNVVAALKEGSSAPLAARARALLR